MSYLVCTVLQTIICLQRVLRSTLYRYRHAASTFHAFCCAHLKYNTHGTKEIMKKHCHNSKTAMRRTKLLFLFRGDCVLHCSSPSMAYKDAKVFIIILIISGSCEHSICMYLQVLQLLISGFPVIHQLIL